MDFLFFSNTGWQTMDGAHRPAQFARELVKRGHRVLFIELENSPNPPRTENLRVVTPRALGLNELESARAWYGQTYGQLEPWRAGVQRALDEFERAPATQRVALWTIPFAPLVELAPLLKARGYFLVYDCLDDFEGLSTVGYHLYFPAVEKYLVAESDLLVVLSSTLYEKFRAQTNNLALIRDGVTLGDFANVPPPRVTNESELHLGFWGTIMHFMVDVNLLEYVARARPNWRIDLIGPYDTDPLAPQLARQLTAHPNIRLLGRQPHASLAKHLADINVCLLPSPVDRFNRGRDPVKIYEYLAGYRPVVATNLPQLEGMPYVFLARDDADFVAQVEQASATPIERAVVDDFLKEQTWTRRVDDLLENIARVAPRTSVAPFVAPPPNDSSEALRAYIALLESRVDARAAHVRQLEQMLSESGIRPRLRRWWKRIGGNVV